MLADILIITQALAGLAGGILSLFAGRKYYKVWLGFAVNFFMGRILDFDTSIMVLSAL